MYIIFCYCFYIRFCAQLLRLIPQGLCKRLTEGLCKILTERVRVLTEGLCKILTEGLCKIRKERVRVLTEGLCKSPYTSMHEGHSFLSKNPCKKPISFANWLVRQLSGRPVLTNGKRRRWWRSLFRYAAPIAKMRAYNLNQTNWATWLFTRWMRSELYRVNPQCIEIILTNFGICLFKWDVNAVFNNKFKKNM